MKEEGFNLLQGLKNFCNDILFTNIPKILISLLILWIGWKLIKVLDKILRKFFDNKKLDVSLRSFLCSIIGVSLKVLLIITVAGMIGIQMTSFIAILGAAGLAVGMALQGTLQNFAGGVVILLLKPYRVGDFIEQGGISGTVKEIQIFNTVVVTPDCKVIIVPNTQLATGTLTNFTRSEYRRVDVNVGIAYGADVEKARNVLVQMANTHSLVIQDAEHTTEVVVNSLGARSIDLQLRAWVKTSDYWTVHTALHQGAYEKLEENNIEIPYNQFQVQLNQ